MSEMWTLIGLRTSVLRYQIGTSCAFLIALTATPSWAQDSTSAASVAAEEAALESFPNAYFDEFQPETALDMVTRVPGFRLSGGGGGRGFGEANTNFLINGRRPSTKSQDAEDILSRIPAATVIRIEILDGASLDIPGLSGQVANIVSRAVDLSGNWRYAARFEEGTEPQVLEGEFVLAGKRGNVDFSIALQSGQFTFSEDSEEDFFDGDGRQIEDRVEDLYFRNTRPGIDANLMWTRANGDIANLNGSIDYQNRNSGVRERFIALIPERENGQSVSDGGEDEIELELTGDYETGLGAGRLKLIGLYRMEDSDFSTRFLNVPDGQPTSFRRFDRDDIETEIIGRAEYGWSLSAGQDIQISGEYAFNALDSETLFTQTGLDTPIADAVKVEEDRFEGRVTHSWQVSPKLSLQTSLAAEYSELGVIEPSSPVRSFFRPKGFSSLSYQQSDTYRFGARIERGVGQLNFGDFVSTRSLQDDVQNSGNNEIVPTQFWGGSLTFERIDETLLSGKIEPFIRFLEDPVDRILFPDGSEGPGNLDNALRYGVSANATLLFDSLGAQGLRLEGSGELGSSRIDDPVTAEQRPINQTTLWAFNLQARYDIPKTDFALEANMFNDRVSEFFRLDETRQIIVDDPFLSFSVIHKDFFGMTLSVTGQNLLDNTISRERLIFGTEDRRAGPLTERQVFGRRRGRRLSIVLSDTF